MRLELIEDGRSVFSAESCAAHENGYGVHPHAPNPRVAAAGPQASRLPACFLPDDDHDQPRISMEPTPDATLDATLAVSEAARRAPAAPLR